MPRRVIPPPNFGIESILMFFAGWFAIILCFVVFGFFDPPHKIQDRLPAVHIDR